MTRHQALVLIVALVGAGAARATSTADVPIEVHDGHVYVKVSLNNAEPLWFLVDSGAAAPVNLIDRRVAERLKLTEEGAETAGAIGGSVRITFTPPVTLKIDDLEIPPGKLGVISLSDHEQDEGHEIDGILGFSFFSALNPQIDYGKQRMFLSDSPPDKNDDDAVPLRLIEQSCRINADIVLAPGQPSVSVTLVVDTGYDGSLVLNTPFVEKHKLLQAATGSIAGGSLGGKTQASTLRIPSLRIGKHANREIETRLSTDREGAFSTPDVDGYIGSGILQLYVVLFDYKHKRLVMKRQE